MKLIKKKHNSKLLWFYCENSWKTKKLYTYTHMHCTHISLLHFIDLIFQYFQLWEQKQQDQMAISPAAVLIQSNIYLCMKNSLFMCVSRSPSCWMTRGVKQNVKSCLRTERRVPPPPTHHNAQRPTAAFQPGTAWSFSLPPFISCSLNKMLAESSHAAPFCDWRVHLCAGLVATHSDACKVTQTNTLSPLDYAWSEIITWWL